MSPAPSRTAPRPSEPRTGTDWLRLGEDWLGRVGVLLLLLGLAFFYRYAIERGWITPELRVAFGLVVGGTLLVLGLGRLRRRPLYSQVLLGGGVAVLYLTGWAAQVLYGLVPWILGFSWMATVTVLALALAERREHQVLAVIGAAGGLATPFLLEAPTESVSGLVVYGALVLAWSGLLQLRRGWGVLLSVNVVGGMSVMGLAAAEAGGVAVWIAQTGIVVAWVVGCGFPYLQGFLHLRDAGRWPPPPAPVWRRTGSEVAWSRRSAVLWLLGVGASSLAALLTVGLWDLGRMGAGFVFLGAAGVLLGGSRMLEPHGRVSGPALGSGAALLLVGTALAVGPRWMALPLAVEAAGLLWIAGTKGMPLLGGLAHGVFALLAIDYVGHLGVPAEAVLSPYAVAVLGAMAVGGGTAALVLRPGPGVRVYFLGSYVAFLAWLAWRLAPLPGGQGVASGAWGLCAVLLLGAGAATGRRSFRLSGLATLAAVAVKLLLVDLSALDAGVRILLFLGFGVLFLVLGYVFKGRDEEVEGPRASGA